MEDISYRMSEHADAPGGICYQVELLFPDRPPQYVMIFPDRKGEDGSIGTATSSPGEYGELAKKALALHKDKQKEEAA